MKIALLVAVPFLWATAATAQTTPSAKVTAHSTATTTKIETKKNLLGSRTTTSVTKAQGTASAPIPAPAAPKVAPPALAPKALPAPPKPKPAVSRSTGRERVLVGDPSPSEVVAMIKESLRLDSTGNRPIDPAHCSPNQDGCGTPNDLLVLFQKADPKYGLASVQQLPEYVGQLEEVTLPERLQGVKVWMGCLKATGSGNHRAVWDCLSREFRKGEKVYMSRKTQTIVNPGGCWNGAGAPDVKKVELECDEIDVWMNPGEEIHRFWISNEPLPADKCNALMKAGEDEWSHLLLDECPRDRCDGTRPAQQLGMPVNGRPVSFVAHTAGWHKFRVTRQVERLDGAFVFCLIWPGGYESMGKDVHKTAYSSFGRAYIAYSDTVVYPNGLKKSKEQVIPPEWRGTVFMWQDSGERIRY